MKAKWFLEDEVFEEDIDRVHAELTRQGYEYKVFRYVPFDDIRLPPDYGPNDCIICYGSLNLIQKLADTAARAWVPGWWCTLPNFLCTTYFTHFGKYLFNSEYVFVTVAEFPRLKDWLFKQFGVNDRIFIRPNTGFKTFTGQILERDCQQDWEWVEEYSDPTDLILISSPKHIDMEWRLVVSGKQVIAGCQYKTYDSVTRKLGFDPDPHCPIEPMDLATRIAQEVQWQPDPIYVMDICKSGGEYRLLELNAFSTAGWYDCDPAPLIEAANSIAVAAWQQKHGIM